jgi:hypothetical protein
MIELPDLSDKQEAIALIPVIENVKEFIYLSQKPGCMRMQACADARRAVLTRKDQVRLAFPKDRSRAGWLSRKR